MTEHSYGVVLPGPQNTPGNSLVDHISISVKTTATEGLLLWRGEVRKSHGKIQALEEKFGNNFYVMRLPLDKVYEGTHT